MPSSWKSSALEPARRILASLTGAIYPWLCPLCQTPLAAEGIGFCPKCAESIQPISRPFCPSCGEPFASPFGLDHRCGRCLQRKPPFARGRAYGLYQGALAEGIRRLKFSEEFSLVQSLSGLLAEAFARELADANYDLVIPVPLHPKRLRERGFNQVILLAQELCRRQRLRLDCHNLRRVRDTPPQIGLTRNQREQNLKGAFALRTPKALAGRRVLLVDDILTTGATARECARTLKRAKASGVDVLVLARVG